ncbi:MAG: hypothetical protein KAS12_04260, partial [Candidatus Aenigmarchaeota archaeon]|nr:hypothetical protein [Candidatus Aenigmarchaeota archaeon]
MMIQGFASVIIAIFFWILGLPQWGLNSGWLIIGSSVFSQMKDNIKKLDTSLKNPASFASRQVFSFIMFVLMGFTQDGLWDVFETNDIVIIITSLFLLSFSLTVINSKNRADVTIFIIFFVISGVFAPFLAQAMPTVDSNIKKLNNQVQTAETIKGVFSEMGYAIEDSWEMLIDPVGWQEKQKNKKGKQEGSDGALEIKSVKTMPENVMPGDEYAIMFELKNFGKNDATNVHVGAAVDEEALLNGAYIQDPNGIKVDGKPIKYPWLYITVDDVHRGEQRFQSFDVVAPKCSGTFETKAYVEYTYNAIATTNLELINKTHYDDLLSYDKLIFKDQQSTSSAGPFKLTIRTEYPQPIPVTKSNGDANEFTMYFTAMNEREGEAYINDIFVDIPQELEVANEDTCELTTFKPGGVGEKIKGVLDEIDLIGVIDETENTPITDNADEEIDKYTRYHLAKVLDNDDSPTKSRCVAPRDMTYFKCKFKYK